MESSIVIGKPAVIGSNKAAAFTIMDGNEAAVHIAVAADIVAGTAVGEGVFYRLFSAERAG